MIAALLLLFAQEQTLAVDTSFQGTPEEAMQAVARLSGDEYERAAALAEGFAEDARWPETLRAEFRYAEGVVRAGAGAHGPAVQAFASARALAGPGELRVAATYNQGTAELLAAEEKRLATFKALQDPPGPARPRRGRARTPWRRCARPTSARGPRSSSACGRTLPTSTRARTWS